MKRTLYFYLIKELFPAFLLGLIGFTFILLTGRIVQLMELFVNNGVLLVYYLLTNAGTSLAERGVVLLEAGMWSANAVFLTLGVYLLVKAANESPVLLFVWIQRAVERFRPKRGEEGKAPR
jgi:lipopolysaccharide export LptBFGC system permease protein LptF